MFRKKKVVATTPEDLEIAFDHEGGLIVKPTAAQLAYFQSEYAAGRPIKVQAPDGKWYEMTIDADSRRIQ